MTLKQIIYRLIHLKSTLHNYELMEMYIEQADKVIEQQGDKIQSLELEHEYLNETDKLFHHSEQQRKQISILQQSVKNKKDRIKLLEKSNAYLHNEIDKLNKQIIELNEKLHKNA